MIPLNHRSNRAFTLIEIVVMLGILALLAALMINNIGGIFGSSQQKIAKMFVQDTLKISLERYRMDMGSYPSTAEGLSALITAPTNAGAGWQGPYIQTPDGKMQLDPFGEPYQYRQPGTHNKSGYDLFSKGVDKSEGTEDDIGNW
ncbi:MAG TPA: type II secretion system major pseudopilin GspG [Lacunisphaera sp.]|nr:type II secretion system major pseudopilin GspG [Lacunisphaera sp.]